MLLTKAYKYTNLKRPAIDLLLILLRTAQDQFVFINCVAIASLRDDFRAIINNQKDGRFSNEEIHRYLSSAIYPDEYS